jgi:hypothetical protein
VATGCVYYYTSIGNSGGGGGGGEGLVSSITSGRQLFERKPPSYEFSPSSFSCEREKRESRDIGEFPVNGTSPMIGAHKTRKRKKKKGKT